MIDNHSMNKEKYEGAGVMKCAIPGGLLVRLGYRATRVCVYHLLWKNQAEAIPVTDRGGP
jgi:hypothetical protein